MQQTIQTQAQIQPNSISKVSYKKTAVIVAAAFVSLILIITVVILLRDNEVESNNPNQQNAVVQPTQGLEQPQPTSLEPTVEESEYEEYSGNGISFMYPTGWNVETVVSEISLKNDCDDMESELDYSGLNVVYVTSPDKKNKLELRLTSSCFTGGGPRTYYNPISGRVYTPEPGNIVTEWGSFPDAYSISLDMIGRIIFIHDDVVRYYLEPNADGEYYTDDIGNYIQLEVFPVEYNETPGITTSFDVDCDITQPELCEEFVTTFFETVKKI